MPLGRLIEITTPEFEKYKNDCLHPCIRHIANGFMGHKWWMVQSPFYARNNRIENPILYYSDDEEAPMNWIPLGVINETPTKGFNSDPSIYYENDTLWVFWREFETPFCDANNVSMATVGVFTTDGITFSKPKIYLKQNEISEDTEQCPILIKRNNNYIFYASHYQYSPERKNIGISIWEGSSLHIPDFKHIETISIKSTYVCDKFKQLKIGKSLYFFPKPLKHNFWHFDLIEYNNKLYMISVAEWSDNIILSVSENYRHFKSFQKPLINSHYSENYSGYRQYYYKPTGYIDKGILHLYYTTNDKNDFNWNRLFYSKVNLYTKYSSI